MQVIPSGRRVNRRVFISAIALVGGVTALAACSLFYPTATIRYRTTVEVETPQGLRTGTSVTEVERIEKEALATRQ